MDEESQRVFAPLRTENILNSSSPLDHGYPEHEVEKSERHPSDASTGVDDMEGIQRTQTTQSVRDRRQFEQLQEGDRERLRKIVSQFDGSVALSRSNTRTDIERRDTLASVKIGDPVLDPNSKEFDPYKWSRM
jgi:ATP-binding cassette subfamily G (WHITE) protein 2 (PDR)